MTELNQQQGTLNLDGTSYVIDDLTEAAQVQVKNVQLTEAELQRLSVQLGLAQTARNVYTQALVPHLPEKEAHVNKKKDTVTIDGKKYSIEDFNDQGKAQLKNLQFTMQRLLQLQGEQAIAQTARAAYVQSLKNELPGGVVTKQ